MLILLCAAKKEEKTTRNFFSFLFDIFIREFTALKKIIYCMYLSLSDTWMCTTTFMLCSSIVINSCYSLLTFTTRWCVSSIEKQFFFFFKNGWMLDLCAREYLLVWVTYGVELMTAVYFFFVDEWFKWKPYKCFKILQILNYRNSN